MNLTKNRRIVQPLAWISMLIVGFFLGRIASAKFRDNTDATMQRVAGGKHHNNALDGATYLAQMKVSTDQHPYSALHQAKVAACIAEFERKKDRFHYEGDIMARMREIVAEGNTEMELQTNLEARLLFHQWLCKNPRELFSSMALIDIYKLGASVGYDVTLSHLRTLPDKEVDEIIKYAENSLDQLGVMYFRKQIQQMRSENDAEKIITTMMQRSESVRGDCWQAIVAEFPPSMDSQLIEYIVKQDAPDLLVAMQKVRTDQLDYTWLESLMEKKPDLIDLINRYPDTASYLSVASMTLSPAGGLAPLLSKGEIYSIRLSSPDYDQGNQIHALVRSGQLTEDNFHKILKDMDQNHVVEPTIQNHIIIIRTLSKSSVALGIKYLSSVSEETDREFLLANALGICEPDAFYEFVAASPLEPESKMLRNRFDMWLNRSLSFYRDYGDDYASWVMALPYSDEKEMALSALSVQTKTYDPDLSERLLNAKKNK